MARLMMQQGILLTWYPIAIDEPMFSSLGGHTVERVIAYGNNNGTQEGNVRQCLTPISFIAAPHKGIVPLTMSPTTSYTKLVTGEPSRNCTGREQADVAISVEFVRAINECFANTVYGFFLGKRVAYLVFSSKDGLDAMLENGPWFFRNTSFILKMWNPNLLKEDVEQWRETKLDDDYDPYDDDLYDGYDMSDNLQAHCDD
ncbi:hypothetical protein Tco_0608959 [Tanacetum coccineum]